MKSRMALYGLIAVVVVILFYLRSTEPFVIATASNQTPWYMSSTFMVPVFIVVSFIILVLELKGVPIHCIAVPLLPGCM